jgi:hypothetical protein
MAPRGRFLRLTQYKEQVNAMERRIRNLIMAAFVIGIASETAAQTGGVLSGVVYDRAGNPVPGVVLTIVDPEQQGARVVVTDQRGAYFVDRLRYAAEYTVKVSHRRFNTSRVEASANEGELPIDITLQPRRSRLARLGSFSLRVLRLGFATQPSARPNFTSPGA